MSYLSAEKKYDELAKEFQYNSRIIMEKQEEIYKLRDRQVTLRKLMDQIVEENWSVDW